MADAIDSHPREGGNLWQDPELFEIYNTQRDLFRETHSRIVQKVLDSYVSTDGLIAEIGSGSGHLYSLLPDPYKSRVVGIEGTPRFAALQKKGFPESKVISGDAYSIPLADSSVKAVLSFSVYDTFQDLERAVAETCRLLQVGGKFIHFLDLQPNFGIFIKDIPIDQIPFPVYIGGRRDRFVLVRKKDYENRIRPNIDPRKIPLFDLYIKDPVKALGFLESSEKHAIIEDIAETVSNFNGIDKAETPIMKERFKERIVKELEGKGFRIMKATDISETQDVPPNRAHLSRTGKNLFIGDVGQLWVRFDPAVPPGMVREVATLQVIVAEKI